MAIDDFLNPTSMLTPGICGSVAMTIGNTLWCQFGVQQKFSVLALSFLMGMVIWPKVREKVWKRFLLYFFNSLVIFSTAIGVNSMSGALTGPAPAPAPAPETEVSDFSWLPSAYAVEVSNVGTNLAATNAVNAATTNVVRAVKKPTVQKQQQRQFFGNDWLK